MIAVHRDVPLRSPDAPHAPPWKPPCCKLEAVGAPTPGMGRVPSGKSAKCRIPGQRLERQQRWFPGSALRLCRPEDRKSEIGLQTWPRRHRNVGPDWRRAEVQTISSSTTGRATKSSKSTLHLARAGSAGGGFDAARRADFHLERSAACAAERCGGRRSSVRNGRSSERVCVLDPPSQLQSA
jgi:hypothetical protein